VAPSSDIRELLTAGRAAELIGRPETHTLDFKAEPYHLGSARQKFALAKDISSFLNGGGGELLLGVKTTKDPALATDIAKELKPFNRSLLDTEQILMIVSDWIYPSPQGIDIQWYSHPSGAEQGLVLIEVPAQPLSSRPFVVKRYVSEDDAQEGVVYAYFERRASTSAPISAQEVQTLMRDGLVLRAAIDARTGIVELTSDSEVAESPSGPNAKDVLDATTVLANEAGLGTEPLYTLAAAPTAATSARSMFASADHPIVKLLTSPPMIRPSGFDLRTLQTPDIVGGQSRRSVLPGYKGIELTADGILSFVATGGDEYLSWGNREPHDPYRINPVALLESILLFCKLAWGLYELCSPPPKTLELCLQLKHMCVGGKPPLLRPYSIGEHILPWDQKVGPYCDATLWSRASLVDGPHAAAFSLAATLYQWFGIEHDKIPYTLKNANPPALSEAALQNP
jgi:hypothetical protein